VGVWGKGEIEEKEENMDAMRMKII